MLHLNTDLTKKKVLKCPNIVRVIHVYSHESLVVTLNKDLNVRIRAGQGRIHSLRFYFKALRVKLCAQWVWPEHWWCNKALNGRVLSSKDVTKHRVGVPWVVRVKRSAEWACPDGCTMLNVMLRTWWLHVRVISQDLPVKCPQAGGNKVLLLFCFSLSLFHWVTHQSDITVPENTL